ncbi:hypothetical protein GQ55_5G119300 [Panicum hallii var. hallii]|uniref:Uncharacterized protein n=1 Tax=Panicum hallii var. hallii TaxID=1504633 RepID=A0A2T7DFE9_9POAL|nr:hypothetical protein GQ55_5G119300 [Panicum hallii var. hallii]
MHASIRPQLLPTTTTRIHRTRGREEAKSHQNPRGESSREKEGAVPDLAHPSRLLPGRNTPSRSRGGGREEEKSAWGRRGQPVPAVFGARPCVSGPEGKPHMPPLH